MAPHYVAYLPLPAPLAQRWLAPKFQRPALAMAFCGPRFRAYECTRIESLEICRDWSVKGDNGKEYLMVYDGEQHIKVESSGSLAKFSKDVDDVRKRDWALRGLQS